MLNYPMGLGMYGMGLGGLGMMGLGRMMGMGGMGLGGMGMGMGYPYGMMMQNPYGYSGMVRSLCPWQWGSRLMSSTDTGFNTCLQFDVQL
jgi:hypothetical protein